ncbi:hypothetical protein Tco_1515870 [Tanacetum coccineum]
MPRILIPLRPILGVLQIGIKSQVTIMSDSEHSTVTYTSLSEDDLYMGSPGVEVLIYEAPPSPDYVPGPEEPEQAPPSLLHTHLFRTWYIPESDPEEDLEEDDEEDPEEDPADYPADRGDDDDEPSSCEPAAVALFILPDPYILIAPRLDVHPNQAPTPFLSRGNTLSTIYLTITHLAQLMLRISVIPDLAGIRRRDALPSHVHDTEIPEMWLPLRKRLCRTTPVLDTRSGRFSAAGTASWDTWDDLVGAIQDIATNHPKRGSTRRVIEFVFYLPRVNTLEIDSHLPQTLQPSDVRKDARPTRAAWGTIDGCSSRQLVETLKIVKSLKAQMIEIQRQQGPAKDPAEPELPEEAGSNT